MFRMAGYAGQVDFLEDAKSYQHHLRSVYARSLGRQLTLYGGNTLSRFWAWGEFVCFLKD